MYSRRPGFFGSLAATQSRTTAESLSGVCPVASRTVRITIGSYTVSFQVVPSSRAPWESRCLNFDAIPDGWSRQMIPSCTPGIGARAPMMWNFRAPSGDE